MVVGAELGMVWAGKQQLLSGQGRTLSTRVLKADAIVALRLPHRVLHYLYAALLVPGAVQQVERLAGPRDDPELQLVPEPGPAQALPVRG